MLVCIKADGDSHPPSPVGFENAACPHGGLVFQLLRLPVPVLASEGSFWAPLAVTSCHLTFPTAVCVSSLTWRPYLVASAGPQL